MTPSHGIHGIGSRIEPEPQLRAHSHGQSAGWRPIPPSRHAPELYVWGKHPAWRDFIDGAFLPPPPERFRDFHRKLRCPIEGVYATADREPLLLVWQDRGGSALVLILPSHDAVDPVTGGSRRSPLFVGLSGRGAGAIELLALARRQLSKVAGDLRNKSISPAEFIAIIGGAQSNLASLADAPVRGDAGSKSAPADDLSALLRSAALGLGVEPSFKRRPFTMICGQAMGSAYVMPVAITRATPDMIRQALLAPGNARDAAPQNIADAFKAANANPRDAAISAPSLPPSQSTPCDTRFEFSTAAGNAIRLTSANPRRKSIRVRLSARRGTIRLPSAAGLTFSLGDGAGDRVVMEFGGPVNLVNAALDGLRFTPSRGFTGMAALQVMAQDPTLGPNCARSIDTSIAIEVRNAGISPSLPLNVER